MTLRGWQTKTTLLIACLALLPAYAHGKLTKQACQLKGEIAYEAGVYRGILPPGQAIIAIAHDLNLVGPPGTSNAQVYSFIKHLVYGMYRPEFSNLSAVQLGRMVYQGCTAEIRSLTFPKTPWWAKSPQPSVGANH